MKVVLQGKPLAKMRARHYRKGNMVVTYDPQKHDKELVKKKFEIALKNAFNSSVKSEVLDASNLSKATGFEVEFWFYLPIAESESECNRNAKLWGLEMATCKPDYDNLEKFYLDCANGVLWPDDRMIIDAHAHKRYSENPRMEVVIMPKKRMKLHEKVEQVIKIISPNQLRLFLYDVKKLNMLDPDCLESLTGQELELWLTASACLVSEFVDKHLKTLKKIQSKTNGDITSEVKSYLELKRGLEEIGQRNVIS